MGIEPTTSAVLRPRHNQLDHPSADTNLTYCIQYLSNTKKTSSTTDWNTNPFQRGNLQHMIHWHSHTIIAIIFADVGKTNSNTTTMGSYPNQCGTLCHRRWDTRGSSNEGSGCACAEVSSSLLKSWQRCDRANHRNKTNTTQRQSTLPTYPLLFPCIYHILGT